MGSQRKKIWVAMSTPFQVNIFFQLMKRLQDKVDFVVTARDHDRIIPMLEAKDIEYYNVGKHGGKELDGKLQAYADTIQQLIPIVKREKPDLLITERWPEAVRTAFGLGIPSWTIFYDEREFHVNWMTFPLSSKIFVPSFYTFEELKKQGVTDVERIIWFNGFHTCYLKDSEIDRSHNPFVDQGLKSPIVLVRPEPEVATFFTDQRKKILDEALRLIGEESDADIVVFPRDKNQAKRFPKNTVKVFDDVTFDCPVAYADVTLGAAETMLMESFVLGTPTVSAVYWSQAKPVTELHKYIPHSTDPKQLAYDTMSFFNSEKSRQFREMAKTAVGRMDNPVDKMVQEIEKLFDLAPPHQSKKGVRRSRVDMLMDILQHLSSESLIFSHLMQKTNLTHSELKSDLELLNRNGLIESLTYERKLYYRSTEKGQQILRDYKKVMDILDM